jgi:hypothetical protein
MTADYPRRRVTDQATLEYRIEQLEHARIKADGEHDGFRTNDGATAAAVSKLADSINDPRTGLIVELANFRREVQNDRRLIKAWMAGAAFVISLVFSIITIYAPSIRDALSLTQ